MLIRPAIGMRGGHVVAVNRTRAVDASGFHRRATYLEEYSQQMREHLPTWRGALVDLNQDPAGWEFCRTNGYRHPSQFPQDPVPRAEQFIVDLYQRVREKDPRGIKVYWADFPGGEALVAYFTGFDGYEQELAIAKAVIQITINGTPTQSVFDDIIQRILRCPEGSVLCDMWRQVLRWGASYGLVVPLSEPFPWG